MRCADPINSPKVQGLRQLCLNDALTVHAVKNLSISLEPPKCDVVCTWDYLEQGIANVRN